MTDTFVPDKGTVSRIWFV